MKKYLGVDLGTSSVKLLVISENGIEATVSEDYPVSYPEAGYSEQNPADWYNKTLLCFEKLSKEINLLEIVSISFSGQMHGLVMLDENDEVIRPAILWNDGRSTKEVKYLNEKIGIAKLLSETGNIAFAGFTAPKLMWVKNNEPENFAKAKKIMLPKDYLAYMLSGVFATDTSDAAGTLYFDTKNRCWSDYMLKLIGITKAQLPAVYESYEAIGNIKPELAERFNISKDCKVVIGAGDNAASAVGTGTVNDGDCNISLGTSGTIFVNSSKFACYEKGSIHSFCSATGEYHYLACILSAASAQKWWIEDILKADYNTDGLEKYIGKNSVYFLPYLTGERSPVNDAEAKAIMYGMTPATTREEMTLSILEGVAFALRQNLEIIRNLGVNITTSKICGGGARNKLWLKIIASVCNVELLIPEREQGGALGAALLAARGVMNINDYTAFASQFYTVKETVKPDLALVSAYEKSYEKYIKLYPALKNI